MALVKPPVRSSSLVPLGIAAAIGLVGTAQQPASADDDITVYIYGANFPHRGVFTRVFCARGGRRPGR